MYYISLANMKYNWKIQIDYTIRIVCSLAHERFFVESVIKVPDTLKLFIVRLFVCLFTFYGLMLVSYTICNVFLPFM